MRALVLVLAAIVQQGGCSLPRTPREASIVPTKHINTLWEATWTDKLKQNLLLSYDKFARPKQHGNKTTVSLKLTLKHLDIDEKKSIIIINAWALMSWEDEKLKWEPDNYGGLKELRLAEHEIWQPDLFPYNSATGSMTDYYGSTNFVVVSNGTVVWVPPAAFHVFCELDFMRWPFDTQSCQVKIGSWTYSGDEIDLAHNDEPVIVYEEAELIPNPEWEFVKMKVEKETVYYPCCTSPYVDLSFYITMKRHSETYKALIITPASAIVLMTLASFWLPHTSGDKITLSGAAVVTTCLVLLYFTQKIPVMAGKTPYIVSFYSRCLYLISINIVISVMVINLAKNPKTTSLPWVLKKNLTGWLGKCLLIKNLDRQSLPKAEEMTDSQPVLSDQNRQLSENNSKGIQGDWVLLATAIDRICFLLYCFIFIILALTYSV